jgi:GAF domain-containing protein
VSAADGSGRGRPPPAEVLGQGALDALLHTVVSLARATVDGTDGVSVSVVRGEGYATATATDDVVRELDAVQYQERSGPCVEAIDTAEQVAVARAEAGARYPRFAASAQQRFMTGVLSTPLTAGDDVLGALNCYSASTERFSAGAADVATQIAGHASVLLANATTLSAATTTNEQLEQALVSRDVIGQAKGILMERQGCSAEDAFDVLRRASQRQNRKLTAVAQDVVDGRATGGMG